MKHTSAAGTTTTIHSRERIDAVLMIWGTFAVRYKQAWNSSHPSKSEEAAYNLAMNEWCQDITGLRRSDIAKGLEGSKADPRYKTFPPNSMEFRSLCIDDDEERERLFQELVNWKELDQDKKSQKGLFIAQKIDYTNFRRADLERARKMFNAVYSKLLKHIADGKELPEFFTEIEYEAPPPMPVEKRSSIFAEIIGSIGSVR